MSPRVQNLYAFALARYFDWLRLIHRRPLTLFFRDGGIGDILCTFPAAAQIARQRENSLKIYCTNPGFVSLPDTLQRFDRVLGIKCSDLVAAKAARRHAVYRFRYADESADACSSRYLADEFLQQFDLPLDSPWPTLQLGPESPKVAEVFARDATTPVVCIHTGPSWLVREWPLESWDALVARLRQELGFRVLHIGSSRHFREGVRKERPVHGTEDCRDKFSLVESLQLIGRSRLVIGIDSGMIHGAVAMKTPVVGIFGATSGHLRLPPRPGARFVGADVPCLGCHHRRPRLHWQSGCPHDAICMTQLSPDRVWREISAALEETRR